MFTDLHITFIQHSIICTVPTKYVFMERKEIITVFSEKTDVPTNRESPVFYCCDLEN